MKVVRSQWSVVSKSLFCFVAIALLFGLCHLAEAQQPKKVHRIGLLHSASAVDGAFFHNEDVEKSGLMSYGVNYDAEYRRTAFYADKILKGAKPAELPVEQPKKFEFVVNLKTAQQIGLIIPPSVLARADKVIK
jgi:hypothetical protein